MPVFHMPSAQESLKGPYCFVPLLPTSEHSDQCQGSWQRRLKPGPEFSPPSKAGFYCNVRSQWAQCMISPFRLGQLCSPPLFWDIHQRIVDCTLCNLISPLPPICSCSQKLPIDFGLSFFLSVRGQQENSSCRFSGPVAVLLEGQEHGDSLPQLAWLGSGLRASEYPESLFLRIEHNLLDKQNGRERKRSNAQPHLPICLRKLVPGQPTSSGRHTSFRACETTFLPPQRESR